MKQNFTKADEEQLSAYVEYEKALTGNNTVTILANTINDDVKTVLSRIFRKFKLIPLFTTDTIWFQVSVG